MLQNLRQANPDFTIKELSSPDFRFFGRVLPAAGYAPLFELLNALEMPAQGTTAYVPDMQSFHVQPLANEIKTLCYGGLDMEIGYCIGYSHCLNGFEYHQGNEINIAATPAVMMLGNQWDIENGSLSTDKASLYYVPAGTVVELYGTTLHFAPCAINADGFKMGIILPARTNLPLPDGRPAADPLLFAINKWLLVHPDSPQASRGAHIGLTGANLTLNLLR